MTVTSVSYRRLVSRPDFQHEAVEMTADVGEGDLVADVMSNLRRMVNQELGVANSPRADEMRATLRDAVMKVEKVMDEGFETGLPF